MNSPRSMLDEEGDNDACDYVVRLNLLLNLRPKW